MGNFRLPAKALETMATGTRTRGRPKKRWIQNIKEDIQKRGSNIRQAVECVKRQEAVEDIHPCSPIVGNLRVMTDGPEEETAPQTGKLCSWISSSICHCECSSSVGPRLCTSSKLSTSFASVTKQMKDRTFIYPCTQ